jgi:hypothetical protein
MRVFDGLAWSASGHWERHTTEIPEQSVRSSILGIVKGVVTLKFSWIGDAANIPSSKVIIIAQEVR